MKWQEVREIYPNQYVLLSILNSHLTEDKKIIDDVALIRPLNNAKEATDELIHAEKDTIVYHTKNEEIVIEVRKPTIRRGIMR